MTEEDCKNCDKCITNIDDDDIAWYTCSYYDLYIEYIKTCKFKEK